MWNLNTIHSMAIMLATLTRKTSLSGKCASKREHYSIKINAESIQSLVCVTATESRCDAIDLCHHFNRAPNGVREAAESLLFFFITA